MKHIGFEWIVQYVKRRQGDQDVEGKITFKWQSKSKAIPLQALTGPEGSKRLRLPDFKTIGT
jgi:hypothetical protein